MRNIGRWILFRLETALVMSLRAFAKGVPPLWASRTGAAMGWVLFAVFRFRRKIVEHNLEVAFGATMSKAELHDIAQRCYRHFGAMLMEFLGGFPGVRTVPPIIDSRAMDDAMAQGKGVVGFTAHFGSWALGGALLAAAGYPMTIFGGRMANPEVDALHMEALKALHIGVLHKTDSPRTLLKTLRAGQVMGIAADLHESTNRYFVRFFGQPVSVSPGPYRLARLSGAPTIFSACARVEGLRYKLTVRAVPMPEPSGNDELDLLNYAQSCFSLLEADVRTHPEQYLWMHRRFRPLPYKDYLSADNRAFLGE
ncbi:MAG: lysophospholipid acyltransferase family protein [SAR324 cluster bacterium]